MPITKLLLMERAWTYVAQYEAHVFEDGYICIRCRVVSPFECDLKAA